MQLIDQLKARGKAKYLDLAIGRTFGLDDLFAAYSPLPHDRKRLAFLYLDSSIAAIGAILGYLGKGHAVCLLSEKLNEELKSDLEQRYRPAYVHDLSREEIAGYSRVDMQAPWRCWRWERTTGDDPLVAAELDVLLSTSGTTGSAKLVKLSQRNLYENAVSIADYLPIADDDVCPLNLPLDYSYGLSLLTTNSLFGGTLVCSLRSVIDRRFWDDFRKYGMTSIAGTPDLYEMLARFGYFDWDLPGMKYLTQAGGKLREALVQEYEQHSRSRGRQFFTMYGQTEATARMSFVPPESLADHAGSIGRPIRNGSFRIDPDTGELAYAGPNVFGGYVESVDDLMTWSPTDWLATGDIARRDEDGFYYIVGRIKRFAKMFGQRVNLDELERRLEQRFPGARFACARIADNELLVGVEGGRVPAEDVLDYLSKTLRLQRSGLSVVAVAVLPTTANGKIDYRALAESKTVQ
ncbi:AMP-binding protein [Arenimonas sp.]|uniref:AMP-binding protein n=1 Tax=Arenimonas sp. TaxID=1872635 RepID=UPI0039E2685E